MVRGDTGYWKQQRLAAYNCVFWDGLGKKSYGSIAESSRIEVVPSTVEPSLPIRSQ